MTVAASDPERDAARLDPSDEMERAVAHLAAGGGADSPASGHGAALCLLGRAVAQAVTMAQHAHRGPPATIAWYGVDGHLVAVDASSLRPLLLRGILAALRSADDGSAVVEIACRARHDGVEILVQHNGAAWIALPEPVHDGPTDPDATSFLQWRASEDPPGLRLVVPLAKRGS